MNIDNRKYSLGAYVSGAVNAGGKAVTDVHTFVSDLGFKPLMSGYKNRIRRAVNQLTSILKLYRGGIVLIQYPVVRMNTIKLIRYLNGTNITLIALVHDLPAFRYKKNDIQVDIKNLNLFDFLIVHNQVMKNILEDNGVQKEMITLDIFDYSYKGDNIHSNIKSEICFAGNLEKSKFIYELNNVEGNVVFNLYGQGFKEILLKGNTVNVKYKGSVLADELPGKLEGGFGLIWDGESINTCSGLLGEYTKINNPHKLSLYLASNKPVIAWNQAAISNFITKEGVGFTVESLEEIPKIINQLTDEQYNFYYENAIRIGDRLRNGYYTKKAVNTVLNNL